MKANGDRAPEDWRILDDSRNPPQFVIGFPILRTAAIVVPSPCRSDLDCTCGRCSIFNGEFGVGICTNSGPGLPDDFVCRKQFLGDPNITQQRFWSTYTRIHTTDWYNQQCQTPKCLSESRLFCVNPR